MRARLNTHELSMQGMMRSVGSLFGHTARGSELPTCAPLIVDISNNGSRRLIDALILCLLSERSSLLFLS